MTSKHDARSQYQITIKLNEKVCKRFAEGWVTGKVSVITQKKVGRQKILIPRYVLHFEDVNRTQIECGYKEASEFAHSYQERQQIIVPIAPHDNAESAGIVGMELYTKWNVDLNLLSGGPESPSWLKEADAVWLRKCNVLKYHKALSQYEFVYTCGYSRYIPIADVAEIMRLHKGYTTNTNSKIVELVRIANEEWEAAKVVAKGTRSFKRKTPSKLSLQSTRNDKAKEKPKNVAKETTTVECKPEVTSTTAESKTVETNTSTAESKTKESKPEELTTTAESKSDNDKNTTDESKPQDPFIQVTKTDETTTEASKPVETTSTEDSNPREGTITTADSKTKDSKPEELTTTAESKTDDDKNTTDESKPQDPLIEETKTAETTTAASKPEEMTSTEDSNPREGTISTEDSKQEELTTTAESKTDDDKNTTDESKPQDPLIEETKTAETTTEASKPEEMPSTEDSNPREGTISTEDSKQEELTTTAESKTDDDKKMTDESKPQEPLVADTKTEETATEASKPEETTSTEDSNPAESKNDDDKTKDDKTPLEESKSNEPLFEDSCDNERDMYDKPVVIRVTLPEPLDGAEDETQRELAECETQDEYDTKLGAYMRSYGAQFINTMSTLNAAQETTKRKHEPAEADVKDKPKKKRKSGKQSKVTTEASSTQGDEDELSSGPEEDEAYTTENNMRRLNWQKGRQDWSRPSKIKAEVEKVTVDTLAEVPSRMRKYGWAILRDATEIFAPAARFTHDQQHYMDKCTFCVLYLPISLQYSFV
jgi:hypothetical protein